MLHSAAQLKGRGISGVAQSLGFVLIRGTTLGPGSTILVITHHQSCVVDNNRSRVGHPE